LSNAPADFPAAAVGGGCRGFPAAGPHRRHEVPEARCACLPPPEVNPRPQCTRMRRVARMKDRHRNSSVPGGRCRHFSKLCRRRRRELRHQAQELGGGQRPVGNPCAEKSGVWTDSDCSVGGRPLYDGTWWVAAPLRFLIATTTGTDKYGSPSVPTATATVRIPRSLFSRPDLAARTFIELNHWPSIQRHTNI
jgi:hypothetical protein